MIHVIAAIAAKPGQRDALLELFRAVVPAVLAEPGCIEYAPAIDVEPASSQRAAFGPDTFVVVEKWTSLETLAAHATSTHMAEYGAKAEPLLLSSVVHVLQPA